MDFNNGRRIGRMTTGGALTEFTIPGGNPLPNAIVAGPDGFLWYADHGDGLIGRMSTSGVVTHTFALPFEAMGAPLDLAFGSDGNLFFTESSVGKIGRMTPDGSFSSFPLPIGSTGRFPIAIVSGPDGALWFCDLEAQSVGRMTTDGALTDYPLNPAGNPRTLAVGPDGAIWIGVQSFGASIVRVDLSGSMTAFPLPPPFFTPNGLTRGGDGAVWFVDDSANRVARITTMGQLLSWAIPTPNLNSLPADACGGPDGAIWFTENADGEIGRIGTGAAAAPIPAASTAAELILVGLLGAAGLSRLRGSES
jgi:virginiamycin B lyase